MLSSPHTHTHTHTHSISISVYPTLSDIFFLIIVFSLLFFAFTSPHSLFLLHYAYLHSSLSPYLYLFALSFQICFSLNPSFFLSLQEPRVIRAPNPHLSPSSPFSQSPPSLSVSPLPYYPPLTQTFQPQPQPPFTSFPITSHNVPHNFILLNFSSSRRPFVDSVSYFRNLIIIKGGKRCQMMASKKFVPVYLST